MTFNKAGTAVSIPPSSSFISQPARLLNSVPLNLHQNSFYTFLSLNILYIFPPRIDPYYCQKFLKTGRSFFPWVAVSTLKKWPCLHAGSVAGFEALLICPLSTNNPIVMNNAADFMFLRGCGL